MILYIYTYFHPEIQGLHMTSLLLLNRGGD